MKNKICLKLFATTVILFLFNIIGFGQITIAAWTFSTGTDTPENIIDAECGLLSENAKIYADGSNYSDSWSGTAFSFMSGASVNPALCDVTGATNALSLVSNANNNKGIVFKLSISGYSNLKLSYSTRGTASGFTTHEWSYSTGEEEFTVVETIPERNTTSFSTQYVDFSNYENINNQSVVYIKLIVSGATSAQGNNRFDNINFTAIKNSSTDVPVADFKADKTTIQIGNSVQFIDLSTENPTSWEWTFIGGIPATSSEQNPTVIYEKTGLFDVSLSVTNTEGADTETKTDYITINKPVSFFEDFENITGSGSSSYSGVSVAFASGNWYVKGVTSMLAGDRKNGERSIRLRGDLNQSTPDESHRVEMEFDKPYGVGIVSFKYGSYGNHSGGKIQLFVSSDEGLTWESVGKEIIAPSWVTGDETLQTANIEVYKTGNIRIKIEKISATGSTSVNIDDIKITDFTLNHPFITIISPVDNAIINDIDEVEVEFIVSNFDLTTDGRVKFTLDGGFSTYTEESPILLEDLDEGLHTIVLELVNMNYDSLENPVIVTVSFIVIRTYIEFSNINHFDIYPNPTTGKFNVSGFEFQDKPLNKSQLSVVEVEIYDMLGKSLMTFSIGDLGEAFFGSGWVEVDISHLSNGVYLLRVGGKIAKIVKI